MEMSTALLSFSLLLKDARLGQHILKPTLCSHLLFSSALLQLFAFALSNSNCFIRLIFVRETVSNYNASKLQ